MLERSGVVVDRPDVGSPFDPRSHRAVATEFTEDGLLDGTVAAIHAEGYRDVVADRVLQAAAVTVYRRSSPADSPPPP